jgi:thiosulfate dehydrogenase
MNRFMLGFLCFAAGILAVALGVFLYLRLGTPPVAVTDPAFPFEKQVVQIPLQARIRREMPSGSPLQPTAENLLAGAGVYSQHCAFCHGQPGRPSALAPHMYPRVPQLWAQHRAGVVGVSDDPIGETYWKVKNGIRLTGMPAYADLLSEQQMWDVSLLLKSADKPLLPQVQAALAQ